MAVITRARPTWVLWAFMGIAAFFLITEHAAHVFGVLPWLFLLACPFMHLFGHGGHGGHASPGDHQHDDHHTGGAERPVGSP
ncbi:MAG: DUF2933 domain-containing protein [Gemmatimonadota bacterium]